MRDLLVSSLSPFPRFAWVGALLHSLAFFPTLTLRVERGAATAKAQYLIKPFLEDGDRAIREYAKEAIL